ncbi:MAG: hypothetical protein R2681_08610 [Pyrinomonadaceae bacterium]
MKLRTKILIGILCALFISQIPFAVTRWKTGKLASKVAGLAPPTQQKPAEIDGFIDYQGIIHVHSFLGGHSTGTFDELITAADKNALDFVVMTEHPSDLFDTSDITLRELKNNVLFISGSEVSARDGNRFLVVDGFANIGSLGRSETGEFLNKVRDRGSLALVTYPEKFNAWSADFDGIEVFSLHTNAKKMNPFMFLPDLAWSYRDYPELTLARYFTRPDENLAKFDEIAKRRKLTLFAGTDAHSNLGIHIGDDANNKYFDLKFDRYETIFRLVRTHVLIPKETPLNRESLLKSLKDGNSYIGLDILCNTRGFMFSASNDSESKILGEEIATGGGSVILRASAPQISRFKILRNGETVFESGQTKRVEYETKDTGAFRVEVYLDILGEPFDSMPWIISNPIYIK